MSHDHDHDHEPIGERGRAGGGRARPRTRGAPRREGRPRAASASAARIDWLVSRTPANGAKLVARAWLDSEFKRRLVEDARRGRGRARSRHRPGAGHARPREHRDGPSPRRLHALLVLPEGAARPAARVVQEPAVPLARRLRPARRPPRVRRRARRRRRRARRRLHRRDPLPRDPAPSGRDRRPRRTSSPRSSRATR